MEVDAKFREVVDLADLVRPKPRPWRRAGRRLSQKPVGCQGRNRNRLLPISTSQPPAGCVRRLVSARSYGRRRQSSIDSDPSFFSTACRLRTGRSRPEVLRSCRRRSVAPDDYRLLPASMKTSFGTAVGLSSLPPSTYRLQVVPVASHAHLPGQEHCMYCRSRPQYRFDLGRILAATFPGAACPVFACAAAPPHTVSRRQADRFATLRCVQLPSVYGCYQCSARPSLPIKGPCLTYQG
jgi:hypothetical protein